MFFSRTPSSVSIVQNPKKHWNKVEHGCEMYYAVVVQALTLSST